MVQPEERWADIPEYIGYQVSDQGRVRTVDRAILGRDGREGLHRGRVLKPQRLKNGYLEVYLCDGKSRKHRTVHSLVAQMFLGSRPERMDVMHINGDRSDNRVENLAYGTRSENLRGTYAYGGKKGNGKLSLADVDEIRRRLGIGESCRSIAELFKVDNAAIYHIRNGATFAWYEGRQADAGKA